MAKALSPQYRRYMRSPKWRKKSDFAKWLTRRRCVVFPWLRATNSHHLTYRNLEHELPVRDIVPLSELAHWIFGSWLFRKTLLRVPTNYLLRLLMLGWLGGGAGWVVLAIAAFRLAQT